MAIEEVAGVLGVSVSTVRNRVKEGDLKARPKPPGAKRVFRLEFDRSEVERFKRENS